MPVTGTRYNYIYIYVRIHAHVYTRTCTCTCIYTHMYMYVHVTYVFCACACIAKVGPVVQSSSPVQWSSPPNRHCRQRGATSDNPRVAAFLKNTQALRLVNSFCAGPVRGNCRGAKRATGSSMGIENTPLPKRRKTICIYFH